jgi:molecular chaperone DnaJ
VRGRGVPKRNGGSGDLLVTVKVAVPPALDGDALEALQTYAAAEQASGFNPRSGWAGNRP